MMYMDYHVHSFYSFDGKANVEDICAAAINKGLSEICFTEHFSINPHDPSYNFFDYDSYSKSIEMLKAKFQDKLEIRKGIESGEPHVNKEKLDEIVEKFDLDFIIGSVHNIGNLKLRKYMKGKEKKTIYKDYFNEVYKTALYGEFDVLGHLDLMKRYAYEYVGNYNYDDYEEYIEKILSTVIKRGKGIEINTSGMRSDFKEAFPKIEILKKYKELGGEIITIGSDSHDEKYVGCGFDKVCCTLKDLGFSKIYAYKKRKPYVFLRL